MHPAFSVILFTTLSGAGYGLLACLGLGLALGLVPALPMLGLAGLGLALLLVTGGLLASTAHLGRPERAWRAFSQWRSSWLSREGVASVATYLPALILAAGWVILGQAGGWVAAAGALTAVCAAVTVAMTAMIYASLKPIPEWHSPFTLPVYLVLAATSGLVLATAVLAPFGAAPGGLAVLAAVTCLVAWALKRAAWGRNARAARPSAGAATGLGAGRVRVSHAAHSEANFVQKEMVWRVARKHAARLRWIAQALAFALPCLLLVLAALLPGAPRIALAVAAVPVQIAGLLVERWLFFAEARHVVSLYYEGDG